MNWIKDPQKRIRMAWGILAFCVVGWPSTSLTIFAGEPQGVLALSWGQMILAALNILATTDVRKKEEES